MNRKLGCTYQNYTQFQRLHLVWLQDILTKFSFHFVASAKMESFVAFDLIMLMFNHFY